VALSDKERIERLLDKAEAKIKQSFLNIIKEIKDKVVLKTIADLLENGSIDQALKIVEDISQASASIADSFIDAGSDTAKHIAAQTGAILSFDQTNDRAVNFLRSERLRFVTQFSQQQRETTIAAIAEGIANGNNPRQQARVFRDSIGLTQNQNTMVNNYRNALETRSARALNRKLRDRRFDRTVARAIREDKPISQEKIDTMVERYRERMLIFRSETIARTEALRSVNQATHEMYRQAIDRGSLDEDSIKRKWVTARDSRVRDPHSTMNGQIRGFGEPFVSGNGNLLMHPGDTSAPASETINCRCIVTTRIT